MVLSVQLNLYCFYTHCAGLQSLKRVVILPFVQSQPFDVADISPKAQLWDDFVQEGNDGDKVWRWGAVDASALFKK